MMQEKVIETQTNPSGRGEKQQIPDTLGRTARCSDRSDVGMRETEESDITPNFLSPKLEG
jgi:hypothetical protein